MINRYIKRVCVGGSLLFCMGILSPGCQQKQVNTISDTPLKGSIEISVDETFKPVIDEQIKMYESSFPNTHIIADYKPEAECLKDLLRDSATRLVIVTRGLTTQEKRFFDDSLHFIPHFDRLAEDAIAIVVNQSSTDTTFTTEQLRDLLSGKAGREHPVVFDGLTSTSTVRFAMDSILKGAAFDTGVVKAVKSSREVLDYVASDPKAIGMVGISWIGNPEAKEQVEMLNKIKLASLKCDTCAGSIFVKPSQVSILMKWYPLVRGLYYILKENYTGLGSGFVNFMQFERGQLIFKRAYLGSKMGFGIRAVKVNEKLKSD